MELKDNRSQSYNIWQDARYRILIFDEKSQILLLRILSELWITVDSELGDINHEEWTAMIRETYQEFENAVISMILANGDESIPIFDIEV